MIGLYTTPRLTCIRIRYSSITDQLVLVSDIPFKHDYDVRNKISLLTEIKKHTKGGGGLSVRTLKESWKEAPQAIEELEKEGEVYVTRTLKDGQLRMVFWNEIRPGEEGEGSQVEKGLQT